MLQNFVMLALAVRSNQSEGSWVRIPAETTFFLATTLLTLQVFGKHFD